MTATNPTAMPMCPMAATCKGMMQKSLSGVALIVPGIVLIALGVLVVIEPTILVWVMAATFVILGTMMLVMASLIRKFARAMSTHG